MSIEPKIEQTNENTPANTQGASAASGSVAESVAPETEKEINWKRFREARELDRKKREEAEREAARKAQENEALRAALESVVNKPSQNNNYEPSDESEEQKIARLVDARIADKERKDAEARAIREQQELPQKLATHFNDFNQVCSAENLDYLEYHYPEVSAAFKNLPDSYDKWANIYKTVKRFVANPDSRKDQGKAEKNFNKPQSMAAPGVTTTTDGVPTMLDDKRRQANWNRMQKVMRGGR